MLFDLRKFIGILCLALALVNSLMAQGIENVNAVVDGDQILISYDLISENPQDRFAVQVFSSHNNYSFPLNRVNGDVGEDIKPGQNKRIAWSARQELGDYRGELSFEIRSELTLSSSAVFSFVFPTESATIKRKNSMVIDWTGGQRNENVEVDLLKDGKKVQSITQVSNRGQYIWSVPSTLKPGSYTIRLRGREGSTSSEPFKIKRKVPLGLKVLPFAIGAVVVYYVVQNGLEPGASENVLPLPPSPN